MATKIRGRQIETDDFIKSVRNSDLDWTNDVNTASQKAIAQYVASAGGGVLVCTFNGSTMDKTPQEIYEAYQDGKFVVCVAGNIVYSIEEVFFQSSAYIIKFASVINSNGIPEIGYIMYNGSNWSTGLSVMQKQLVSGTTIKTINNESLLGSGDISVGDNVLVCTYNLTNNTVDKTFQEIAAARNAGKVVICKLNNLVYYLVSLSETSNLICFAQISESISSLRRIKFDNNAWTSTIINIQQELVSGTNIKTINGQSILGSGNISIQGGGGGGGLSDYDFTHTIASGVSGTVTVTFAANTRGTRMMTATADIGLTIVCNNSADNYIWVMNNGSSDIDVTINSVTYNNSSMSASKIFIPEDGITIPNGNVAKIGIVCNADGAFITVRTDLKANS